ncbi:hypothetical protein AMTRI_Chr01g126740 [Amborella trichopoda]
MGNLLRRWFGGVRVVLILLIAFESMGRSNGHLPVSGLFILGDSSVNCGNNLFFPSLPFSLVDTSFLLLCNTTLVPDLLAKKLALRPVPPFSGQSENVGRAMQGLNFGVPSATILTSGDLDYVSLKQQIRYALNTLQNFDLALGRRRARRLISSSIFYLSMGAHDYTDLYYPDIYVAGSRHPEFAHILVGEVTRAMKDLYHANVRKIIVAGIGPLGCAPRFLSESDPDSINSTNRGIKCEDQLNDMIQEYNTALSLALKNLSSELPHLRITFCDVYKGLMKMISNPQPYGFKIVNKACCGVENYGGWDECGAKEPMCEDPSTHVWWDGYNPSEGANHLLADWVWSGGPLGICSPMTFQQLAATSSLMIVQQPEDWQDP